MRSTILVAALAASLALVAPASATTSIQACADYPAFFCVSVVSADGGPAGDAGAVCAGTGCAPSGSAVVVCTPYECVTLVAVAGAATETGVVCLGTSCPP